MNNTDLPPNHIVPKDLEYDYICDGIYVGTNHCCLIEFRDEVKHEGIEADLSLEEERIDAAYGANFFIWLPVIDHTSPTQEQFTFGVTVLEDLVRMEKKTLVHCANGHGRSPTMVAAYLIKTKDMTVDEAIAYIKERRPSIHPNDLQREGLEKYRNSLQ